MVKLGYPLKEGFVLKLFYTAFIASIFLLPVVANAQQAPILQPHHDEITSPAPVNPFSIPAQQLQAQKYDGEFSSDTVELSLAKFGHRFLGELFYASTEQTYSVDGTVGENGFSGVFNTGTDKFDFSFVLDEDGDTGIFKTSGFEDELRKDGVAAPTPSQATEPFIEP
ncbi:hypothetical protein MNBD_ALPHA06-1452 [hydrothermal vent metagenome]|uniref:Uncharacterized protein n=1 Tax=hydrothermal vent metagenome TaxID=652676 RepID=A0A3B0SGN1_9ZZZZ